MITSVLPVLMSKSDHTVLHLSKGNIKVTSPSETVPGWHESLDILRSSFDKIARSFADVEVLRTRHRKISNG